MEAGTSSAGGPPTRPPPSAPKAGTDSTNSLQSTATPALGMSSVEGPAGALLGVQIFLLATNEKQTIPYRADLKLKDVKLKTCTRRGLNEKDYKVTKYGTSEALDEELTLGELPNFTDRKLELQYLQAVTSTSSSSALGGKASAPLPGTSSLNESKVGLSTDRNHVLTLKVVSGKGLAAKDEGGTSDPYVSLKWNKKIFKTKVIDKNLNPTWNESFFLGPFSAADSIKVECWDKDTLTDDFMGHFEVNLNTVEKEGTFTQWHSLIPKKKNEFVSGQIQLEFNVTHINTAAAAAEEKKKKGNWLQRKSSRASDVMPTNFKKPGSKPNLVTASATTPSTSQPLFGVELSEVMKKYPDRVIPPPLKEAIDYIRKVGLEKEEGIFRIGGVKTGIAALRETLDSGGVIDYETVNNVHNVTGLLKMFFRELPTPLLTYDLYSRWLAVAELETEKEQKEAIGKLIEELPEPNKCLLGELCVLLYQIAQNHAVNFMDANNLSIVVGPNLIWDPSRNLDASFSTLSQVGTIVTTIIASCPLFFPDIASLYGLTVTETSIEAVTGATSLSEILRNNAADMVSQAKTLFEYVDANGNGTLDREEFHYFFNELMQLVNMPPPTEDEIDEAIATIDIDGNEEIDWEEFLAWWKDSHVRYCH